MSDDIDNTINYIQNWTFGEEFNPPALSVPPIDPDVEFYRRLHQDMFANAHEEIPTGYPDFRRVPFMYMPQIYPNYDMSYALPDFNQLQISPPPVTLPDFNQLQISPPPVALPDFNQLQISPPPVALPDFNQLQISPPVPPSNMFRPIKEKFYPPLELDDFGNLRISGVPPAKRRRLCEIPDFTRLRISTPQTDEFIPDRQTWLELVSNLRNEYKPPSRYEDTNGLREWEYYPVPPRNRRCACLPDDNPPKRQRY